MNVCGESLLLRLSLPVILSLMLWHRAFSRVVVVGLGRVSVGSSGLAGMVTSIARHFAGRSRVWWVAEGNEGKPTSDGRLELCCGSRPSNSEQTSSTTLVKPALGAATLQMERRVSRIVWWKGILLQQVLLKKWSP